MLPRPTIEAFDRHLFDLGLRFEAVVIGGAALGLMGVIQRLLPGWRARLERVFEGQALVLQTLGRLDLLSTKLFALCDRGTDFADCVALAPSPGELEATLPWLEQQDGNEQWPEHVRETLAGLARSLGHAV